MNIQYTKSETLKLIEENLCLAFPGKKVISFKLDYSDCLEVELSDIVLDNIMPEPPEIALGPETPDLIKVEEDDAV